VNGRSVEILNDTCGLLSDMGRHAEAMIACARAIAVAPNEANLMDSLGNAYQAAGDADRAIDTYSRAIRLDATFGLGYVHRGNVYVQTGQYRRAADDYRHYLEQARTPAARMRGYEGLAWIAFRSGARDRAVEYARSSEPLWSSTPPSLLLEQIVSSAGDRALQRHFAQVMAAPDGLSRGSRLSPRFYCWLRGTTARASGNANDALRWFRELLRHRRTTWALESFDDALANALFDLGRFDEAVAEYRRVLETVPSLSRVRCQLARAFDRVGDAGSARREYAAFLHAWKDADRDAPEVVEASAWLAAHP